MRPDQHILLVEDDAVDLMTVKRAMKDLGIRNQLDHAKNGEEALAYLQKNKNWLPGLILLDLNMPVMNGLEFLGSVKENEAFKLVPIVVLTTSATDSDKIESFKRGVAGYLIKPVDYEEFLTLMRTLQLYWSASETALP